MSHLARLVVDGTNMLKVSLHAPSPTELCSEKNGWTRLNYAVSFDCSPRRVADTAVRIDYDQVSEQDFIERFERPNLPVVICGATHEWRANQRWTLEVRAGAAPRTGRVPEPHADV